MRVRYDEVSVRRGRATLLDRLSLDVDSGEILGIVGPNGSGKSTALRCLYRALTPESGAVFVDGTDLRDETVLATARRVAALPQDAGIDLDFSVEQVVATGRFAHGHRGGPLAGRAAELLEEALLRTDLVRLRERGVTSLSGGERQRMLLARALVQEPRVLVLDEPTNHLDIRHQLALLSDLGAPGTTVILALHDLNLAAASCDRLALMAGGRLLMCDTPRAVLSSSTLRDALGVEAHLIDHPISGVPQLLYCMERKTCS